MGMLKRMKDMKEMVNAAPGMVAQSQQLAAQAQEMAAAQQAAAQAQLAQYQQAQFGGVPVSPVAAAAGPDFDPISGVTLNQFVVVSKGVAAYNNDATKMPDVALSHGIDPVSWQAASQGWNDRIKANPAVAQQFNQLYRAS